MVIMDPAYSEADVVVIGGGPAGFVAAIALRQKGLRVVVAERAQAPIDKVCGEGLMPDGLAVLARLGVAIPLDRSVPFRGIRFIAGEKSADAFFPHGFGLGIRRSMLHEILVRHAYDAGVAVAWGIKGARTHSRRSGYRGRYHPVPLGSSGQMDRIQWCANGPVFTISVSSGSDLDIASTLR
jgi:flavin-dependent dehydrogenase